MASKKLIRQRLQFMMVVESNDLATVRTMLENAKFDPDFSTDVGILMYDPDESDEWDEDEWEQIKAWQDEADDWGTLTSPLWEARDKPELFALLRPKVSMDLFFIKLLVPVCCDDADEFLEQLAFLKQQVGTEAISRFFDETIQDGIIIGQRLEDEEGELHAFTSEKLAKYKQMVNQ